VKRTVVLKIDPKHPDKEILSHAAKVIRHGGLVVFPTETVYGIAANLLKDSAIDRLYRVKGRPRAKPFTVHIAGLAIIRKMGCKITKDARALIDKFWPGPLTIILSSKTGEKIGFRMPANRVALELIKMSQVPVAAPSANPSGSCPPTSAEEAVRSLDDKIDLVIDGGRTDVGIESTVIDMTTTPPKILRDGAIDKRKIVRVLKLGNL